MIDQTEQDRLKSVEPENVPTPKSYDLICEDCDARILEYDDRDHDYETFEDAKEDALEYLREKIESCQATFDDIGRAKSFDEYHREGIEAN